MASFTINAGDRFPEGTSVSVYQRPVLPGDLPSGTPVGTQTVAGGSVTFTGLADGTQYVAYAQVGGEDRLKAFRTDPSPSAGEIGRTITAVTASGGDDTAAVQAALNAGDVLLVGDRSTPFHIGHVTYQGSVGRTITALSAVKIIQTDPVCVFELKGGWDELGAVSAIATVNVDVVYPGEASSGTTPVSQLTLAASQTVNRGEVLKVVADDVIPTAKAGGSGLERRIGEYSLAGTSQTGTTVNLSHVLVENYVTSPRLARLWDVSFRIEGPITFDVDPSLVNTNQWWATIVIRDCRNSIVSGCRFVNQVGRAIGNYGFASTFTGLRFTNLANRPSLPAYGYGIDDGGTLTRVVDCHGNRLRHMYTANPWMIPTASTEYSYYGGTWYGHVADCTVIDSENSGFDTHGGTYGISFVGCKAIGMSRGADSGGVAFSLRGRRNFASGCFAEGARFGFSITSAGTTLEGCKALRCRERALSVDADTDAPTITLIDGVVVNGGVFETMGVTSPVFQIGRAGYIQKCDLNDVTLRHIASTTSDTAILLPAGDAGTILRFRNLTLDLLGSTVVSSSRPMNVSVDTVIVKGRGWSIRLPANYTSMNPVITRGGTAQAAALEIQDIDLEATGNFTPVILDATFTAARASWRRKTGAGTAIATSNFQTLTAAAGATLPIATVADPVVTVRLTGTAGAVTLATTPNGFLPGQMLVVLNASNGAVTLGAGGPVVNAAAQLVQVWDGGAWRS